MGTDFVIAGRDEAMKVGESNAPGQEFTGIDAKGMDQVKMGTLHSILTKTEYDPEFMIDEDSFGYVASDDGPWVQMVPDEMVANLAKLSESEILPIADEWLKTDEFQNEYSDWTKQDVITFLPEMISLSQKALAEDKAVFMWTCL